MVAQGNTLGKGPQLFRFTQRGLELLRKLVRAGEGGRRVCACDDGVCVCVCVVQW